MVLIHFSYFWKSFVWLKNKTGIAKQSPTQSEQQKTTKEENIKQCGSKIDSFYNSPSKKKNVKRRNQKKKPIYLILHWLKCRKITVIDSTLRKSLGHPGKHLIFHITIFTSLGEATEANEEMPKHYYCILKTLNKINNG